jgi:hypothetical protein
MRCLARESSPGLAVCRVVDVYADCDADCMVFAIGADEGDAAISAIKRAHSRHPLIPILAALRNYCDANARRAFRAGAYEVFSGFRSIPLSPDLISAFEELPSLSPSCQFVKRLRL